MDPTITPVGSTDPSTLTPDESAAMAAFCDVAALAGDLPITIREVRNCGLFLRSDVARSLGGSRDLPCLAVAQDSLGNWSALFRHPVGGSVVMTQFLHAEVL